MYLLLQDGSRLRLQDGSLLVLESAVGTWTGRLRLQDGNLLLLEDGERLLLESAELTLGDPGLLLEDGSNLLLEDGGRLLLEGVEIPVPPTPEPEVATSSGRPVRRRTGFGVLSPLRARIEFGRVRTGAGATSRAQGVGMTIRARPPGARAIRNPTDEELALAVAELFGEDEL